MIAQLQIPLELVPLGNWKRRDALTGCALNYSYAKSIVPSARNGNIGV